MTNMTPTTEFISTLTQTPILAAALNSSLQKLKNNLDEIIKVLNYSKEIDGDLNTLNNYLSEASELLTFVSVIPEVGEAAMPLKEAITAIQPEVQSAKSAADKIESLVKPLRDAIQKIEPVLDKLISGTQDVHDKSQSFLGTFQAIYNCVESLPSGSAKQTSENYLNTFSTNTQPILNTLNTVMSDSNQAINDFYSAVNALTQALSPLAAIDSAIQEVISTLSPVINLLNQLEDDLKNIKITIPIPYPISLSLYDVFKDFASIAKFIDEALAPIQDLLNNLLNALNIKIDIPNLSEILNIQINIPNLPDFDNYLTEIENGLQAIINAITNFNLKCPPEA
jgi:chromosome segregation ATPase